MATAVASTSFTSLKRSTVFGAGVQGLRAQNVSAVRLAAVPCASAKLSTSTDGLAQQVAVGANTIAGQDLKLALSFQIYGLSPCGIGRLD